MNSLVVMLRFLALLFLVRLAVRFVSNLLTSGGGKEEVDMVRDRICNTFLPRERALCAVVGGREQHFCSPACRDRALALLPAP